MPVVYGGKGKKKVAEVEKMVGEGFVGPSWKSISVLPKDICFEAQNEGETILLLMRSHPMVNLWWMALVVMLLPLPLFWGSFPLFTELTPALRLAIDLLWYLGLFFFGLEKFLIWFYSVFVVTDERIIDIDFYGLLSKNIDVTQVENIEEVNYSQKGILANLFNYGDVVSQTASEQKASGTAAAFTFEAVPEPDRVTRVISELMKEKEGRHQ